MFPKNKINILYRVLCLLSYLIVIAMSKSITTLIVLFIIYFILALLEISFRNIELFVISLIILLLCYWLGNYIIFRIVLVINYIFYFLDASYYVEEKEVVKVSQKEYVRFVNNKKKGTNNISAIYVTLHLVLLVIAIMVG